MSNVERERDIYDEAVEHLRENSSRIYQAWNQPHNNEGGILFGYCGPDRNEWAPVRKTAGYAPFGCLTEIRSDHSYSAGTPELTEEIRTDDRIPLCGWGITVDHLEMFADYQRRLDKELGREPPATLKTLKA